MKILAWHVHGSWMTAFVHSRTTCSSPSCPTAAPTGSAGPPPTAGPPGSGRSPRAEIARPGAGRRRAAAARRRRPRSRAWTGLEAGRDVPAVYVEHNTPRGDVTGWRHPLADQHRIPIVHVTHFNAAMWDNGEAPVRVIEHGIPDPGHLYDGRWSRSAFACNEPVRRTRVAGTDLAARIARDVPVHVYGMKTDGVEQIIPTGLAGAEELAQADLHKRMAEHRAYLHPYRWTSLGLALLEAMTLGMPVLALAATAAPQAVPAGAGLVSARRRRARAPRRAPCRRPGLARAQGEVARAHALEHYGLERFLADWDRLLEEVAR